MSDSETPATGQQASGARPGVRRYYRWTGAAVLALCAIAAAWWIARPREHQDYVTAPVTRGAVVRGVVATGTVNPELTVLVGAYVSGTIQSLSCDFNSKVVKGQVCARIDPRPYQMVVDESRANLEVATAQLRKDEAMLAYAEVTSARNDRLLDLDSVSRDAADSARSAYREMQAQVALDKATVRSRQATLKAAEINLGYTGIVSPVDGTVVSRNVTVGQTVASSFQTPTLFLIASDLTRMEVDTNVSESDIGGVREGSQASFTVDAFPERTFHGTVTQARQSPQTIQNVVTYDIVVSVANDDLALKPGMTAATRITAERRGDVIRVPNAALRYRPQGEMRALAGSRVWVLRGGQAVAVPVRTGLADDANTQIVRGELKAGDQVITASRLPGGKPPAPRMGP
jgi:HlyD family secretion protein